MKGVKALYLKGSVPEIKEDIISLIQPDDIVITAGAGDITNLGRIICK
jgi:UDP-N-acetylmuramate-alanine ligase